MEPDRRHQLSPRQREILLWSCRGKTYVEIGLITGLSKGSIKTYLDQARYKLNVVNLPQACAVAVAEGIFRARGHDPPFPRPNQYARTAPKPAVRPPPPTE